MKRRSILAATALGGLAACSSSGDDPAPEPPVPPTEPPQAVSLLDLSRAFPPMPKELVDLARIRPGTSLTFGSGLPLNDLVYTVFDTDYMEGETAGYDTFMPVDPTEAFPGEGTIKIIKGVNNLDLNASYSGPQGDRIILGTAEIGVPFFSMGDDGVDDDYASISNFDYRSGHIQLRGEADDYQLFRCEPGDGCETDGYYLFHTGGDEPDLIAFVFGCDDLALPISGTPPRDPRVLCNADGTLDLSNPDQFRFADPVSSEVAVPAGIQVGTPGKEVVGGIALDEQGGRYLYGLTDGDFEGDGASENEVFVVKIGEDGERAWATDLALPNGSLIFEAVADDEHLYAVGRTLGALPGFQNAGRWDAIILKLRLSDGEVVATDQFGNAGLDGYGDVTLGGDGFLYVAGAGSPTGADGTDDEYLVAKHRTDDLSNVWRVIEAPDTDGRRLFVSEGWGGLTWVPPTSARPARLVTGGWFMSSGGADGFVEVWEGLDQPAPQKAASRVIASAGTEADWVLDNRVGADGTIYAVGYTTGALGGTQAGLGDAYLAVMDPDLRSVRYTQVGSAQNDAFRKLALTEGGTLYAAGFSYGDYAGSNAADERGRTGDVIVQAFDTGGRPLRAAQYGTKHEERGYVVANGETLLIGGMTEASAAGPSAGSFDGFLISLDQGTLAPN